MEIDFTSTFARKPATLFSVPLDNINVMSGSPMGSEDHCGFCDRPENCLCRPDTERVADDTRQTLAPISQHRVSQPVSLLKNNSAPSFLEAPTRASGPGTCDMCLADPEKARQCRELAVSTQFSSSSQAAAAAQAAANAEAARQREPGVSCSDFLTTLRQKNVQLGPDIYGQVHVYPYSHQSSKTDGKIGHHPAMEIDAHDAAEALTALSRQAAKIVDGP